MKARDIMTPHDIWSCAETDDCRHAARLMLQHDIGSIPVLDSMGRLEGIVTDRDICLRIVAEGRTYETPVREVMSEPVHTCVPDSDLSEVEEVMRDHKVRRLPVVDAGKRLLGFISLGDLARHSHGLWKEHRLAEVLETVSSPGGPSQT